MLSPVHQDEAQRLRSLRSYSILDTQREMRFDRITFIAAQVLKVPIAAVSFIDADRQWFKAVVGLTIRETPRSDAFCAFTIRQTLPLVVEDTRLDSRFAQNALVLGPPFIRFYAGVPLLSEDGLALGSLCVIDRVPRVITKEQLRILTMLTRETEELLYPAEFRLSAARVEPAEAEPPAAASYDDRDESAYSCERYREAVR